MDRRPRRQVRPKKKSSPQGQENSGPNVPRTRDDREEDDERYMKHEEDIIIDNIVGKELKKLEKRNQKERELREAERQRIIAENIAAEEEELEKEELIQNIPRLHKLRKKTKSVHKSKSMKKSRTRKHKTL